MMEEEEEEVIGFLGDFCFKFLAENLGGDGVPALRHPLLVEGGPLRYGRDEGDDGDHLFTFIIFIIFIIFITFNIFIIFMFFIMFMMSIILKARMEGEATMERDSLEAFFLRLLLLDNIKQEAQVNI